MNVSEWVVWLQREKRVLVVCLYVLDLEARPLPKSATSGKGR